MNPNGGHTMASPAQTASDSPPNGLNGECAIPWLREALETVGEFGAASIELVAWELSISESDLTPAWSHAIRHRLIQPVGTCPQTGELMYTVP